MISHERRVGDLGVRLAISDDWSGVAEVRVWSYLGPFLGQATIDARALACGLPAEPTYLYGRLTEAQWRIVAAFAAYLWTRDEVLRTLDRLLGDPIP